MKKNMGLAGQGLNYGKIIIHLLNATLRLILTTWGSTLESDVCSRQILMSRVNTRTEKVEIFIMDVDP